MNAHRVMLSSLILVLTLSSGCANTVSSQSTKSEPPAKMSGPAVKESELATITLTADAETRLGIVVKAASAGESSEMPRFSGEVIVPPGNSFVVSSPIAGTLQAGSGGIPPIGSQVRKGETLFHLVPFIPLPRDLRVTGEADVAAARTRVEGARLRKQRADKMLADEVGTVRAQEETQHELSLATTALQAAENRLRQIQTSPFEGDIQMSVHVPEDGILRQVLVASGQSINAGAPMFEVADLRQVWIRVPVYAGEVSRLSGNAPAILQVLNGTGPSWTAQPVRTPPSADAASSTVDLYYQISNDGLRFKPGEKLSVRIRSSDRRSFVEVPWSAVVFDIHGGSWVYESLGDRHYARRRVELDHATSDKAFLNAGIPAGTNVVTEGVAELWGFEFGTGK